MKAIVNLIAATLNAHYYGGKKSSLSNAKLGKNTLRVVIADEGTKAKLYFNDSDFASTSLPVTEEVNLALTSDTYTLVVRPTTKDEKKAVAIASAAEQDLEYVVLSDYDVAPARKSSGGRTPLKSETNAAPAE